MAQQSKGPRSNSKTRVPKVDCLNCGSEDTANVNSHLDSRGRRIRERRCYDCNTFYNTVYENEQLVDVYEVRRNKRR